MPAPGLLLTVLTGNGLLTPLPAAETARLRSVKVTENDQHRSVFTIIFDAGRSARDGAFDVPLVSASPVGPFARVVLELCFGANPEVLMDGVVTKVDLELGTGPGAATLAVTGEDLSYRLDQDEHTGECPVLPDHMLACAILAPWEAHGIRRTVATPADSESPSTNDRMPTQRGTDLAHLTDLAAWHGFVAYLIPGPFRGVSTFYWGPPVRGGPPQPALSVNLGPETTLSGLRFTTEALAPAAVSGAVFDRRLAAPVVVQARSSQQARLAASRLLTDNAGGVRVRLPRDAVSDEVKAGARAQADVDRSLDAVAVVGTVDGARYGHVLRPRGLVGIRGAGWSYDGLWYVKRVVHDLARGSYRQEVTLTREGYGSTVEAVR